MPKQQSPIEITGTNLHPFFAGLLPEGRRLKALIKSVKTSEDDLFSLFSALGSDCIGDIYAINNQSTETSYSPQQLNEVDFYQLFEKLTESPSFFKNDTSIAGVQEKISHLQISFPVSIASKKKKYILKINPKDKPNLVQNEYQCLILADKCGIIVNKAKLVQDRVKNYGLLVERFDRLYDPATKKFLMIHQEDACQFLNRYPAEKYRLSMKEITQRVEELVDDPSIEILKLLRLYTFSYLIGNGDLHAKNISLQTNPISQSISLTKGYDLLTTAIYGDTQMALKLDGRKDNIKRKTIIDFALRWKIPVNATNNMLDKLLENFIKNLYLLEAIPMEQKKLKFLQQFIKKRVSDLS